MSDKINYTAEDIALYLEGKMSPAQMHAMEKAALSDPFLADALEGIEVHGDNAKFNTDIEELRARLAGRIMKRKKALPSANRLWWKVAAVLVIVVTGVAIITFTGEKNDTARNALVKTEDKIISNEQEERKEDTIKPQLQSQQRTEETANAIIKKEIPVPKKEQKKERNKSSVTEKETVLYNKVNTETIQKADEANVKRDVAASTSPAAAPSADSISRQLAGKVAGVNVDVSKESDSMFDEVVVVGYGNTKKNNNNKSRTVVAGRAEKRVVPANGWDEFEQYVEDNTKINTADSVYKGEEHLSFTIGDDGLPESIKILRSISPSHDKEAIRLLQNGPSWKVAKGRKREIRLKIIF